MSYTHDNNPAPINYTRKDHVYKTGHDDRTAPSGAPSSKRDFKKILRDSDDNDEGVVSAGNADDEDAGEAGTVASKKGSLSLFDLSGNIKKSSGLKDLPNDGSLAGSHEKGDLDSAMEMQNSAKVKTDMVDATERGLAESPSQAYARLMNKKDDSREGFDPGTGSSSGKDPFTTRFSTEQSDLSYVNPMALANASSVNSANMQDAKVLPASNIQDIVNQLVEAANQMQYEGKTDTTITLKHPPILAGANLVVTTFDNAQKQLNVSFENLTQAAQNLLNMEANRESLLTTLAEKGYTVHILTATTLNERPVIADANPLSDRNPDQDNRQRGDQRRRQQG